MKIYFFILLAIFGFSIQAQDLQNANWALADFGGLHFTVASATPISSAMPTNNTASASVSDQQGNLLFYTDGLTVWKADGTVMTNGTGLLGHGGDFSQNILIVPNPLDINRYYIVYISVAPDIFPSEPFHGLRYSEVDMSNGVGVVNATTLNTSLLAEDGVTPIDDSYLGNFGKITSARHANGLDYWIIAEIGLRIYSYLVDDLGIHAPVASDSPLPASLFVNESNSPCSANGPMKISPDNQRLLIGYSAVNRIANNQQSAVYVGSFHDDSGLVDNFAEVPVGNTVQVSELTGAEFSPNSLVVHRTYANYVISCELETIDSSVIPVLWTTSNFNSTVSEDCRIPQRALNGIIYYEDTDGVPPPGDGNFIGSISNPNSLNYVITDNSVDINNSTASSNNIPPWVQWQPCHRYLTTDQTFSDLQERERAVWIKSADHFSGAAARGIYHAGDFVELTPGFETVDNSQFAAYVEGCSDNFTYRNGQTAPKLKPDASTIPANSATSPNLTVYPNPTESVLNVSSQNVLLSLEIYSLDGKRIYKDESPSREKQVDVTHFAKGVYIIRATPETGRTIKSKFIKS